MALVSGTKLGPYEILAPLGAGGMGEVYRARDTRLDRTVAIKIVSQYLADAPEARQRFEREARAVSSLNHPHICTLYDIGAQDGTEFLVMEFLEGETLSERLCKGPLSLAEGLRIGIEMASALDKAHRQGIVHRDLKPGNIMLTKSGAKLMDFGLAKPTAPGLGVPFLGATPAVGTPSPPTLSIATLSAPVTPITQRGSLVGTYQYMAPEVLQGKEAGTRSDIFSFGCVLYEMATGRHAFEGKSQLSVLAAILEKDPEPISKLQAMSPPQLDRLVQDCLAKDPDERLRDAHDLKLQLVGIAEGGSNAEARNEAAPHPIWRRALPWALAGVLAVVAVLLSWAPWRGSNVPESPMRLSVEIGAPAGLATDFGAAAIISPDGSRLVFRAADDGAILKTRLYVRQREQLQAVPLIGTEGARDPFFSPDGHWIAFFADGKLKKIAAQGGAAVTLCEAANDRGGTWSEDRMIIFAAGNREGLSEVSEAGGKPQPLTTLDKSKGETTHRWPQVLPGGKAILFTEHNLNSNFDQSNIVVQILKTGERKTVHQGGMYARYAPSGHLLYAHDGTIFAAPFDLGRLEVTGSPAPFIEHVITNSGHGSAHFDFSKTGALLYIAGEGTSTNVEIDWMDKEGKFQPLRAVMGDYHDLRFSPDGRLLAMSVRDRGGSSDIWVLDWQRDTMSRLTSGPGFSSVPLWTPDGQRIVFSSTRGGGAANLYWVRADGIGEIERLTESKKSQYPSSISPDGKSLAFHEIVDVGANLDIWILPMEGNEKSGWKHGAPSVFLNTPFREASPAFSPDGRWLAYVSDDTGTVEVYVRPFSWAGGKFQISNGGGMHPTWSKDGKELYFRTLGPDHIMASKYRVVGNSFQADKPQQWSNGTFVDRVTSRNFDLAPDGKRFAVINRPPTSENAAQKNDKFVLLLNAFDELRRVASPTK